MGSERPASKPSDAGPAADSGLEELSISRDDNPSLRRNLGVDESLITVRRGDLLHLPAEIIYNIFHSLSPLDLSSIAATCRRFGVLSKEDLLWQEHVQQNVPGCIVKSLSKYNSWRDLYVAYDPYWFLPKYKLWFSDFNFTGKLILVRYDPGSACIEGYRLVVERGVTEYELWQDDNEVVIYPFEPKVLLHKNLPFLQLDMPGFSVPGQSRYSLETPVNNNGRHQRPIFSDIMLARPVIEMHHPSSWPPLIVPAQHRVHSSTPENLTSTGQMPQKRSDCSDQIFRMRHGLYKFGDLDLARMPDKIETFSTLDPKLYTPTADKPFRGIWVGDYISHGCEFLLLHQPDDGVPFDNNNVVQREDEPQEEFLKRKQEERIYRGGIEAIKLTGDPNVPRGEYSFIANDIGKNGLVRVAQETPFKGARIVKSLAHLAERQFRNHRFIDTQLIIISTDLLAHYWVESKHISFFQRVKIDEFLNPYQDRPSE